MSARVVGGVSPDSAPVVRRIVREAGIAGQVGFTAYVTYPGEQERMVTFVGSVYGGPVVMVTGAAQQVFVRDPDRFGRFGREWVERFFGEQQ